MIAGLVITYQKVINEQWMEEWKTDINDQIKTCINIIELDLNVQHFSVVIPSF